MVTRARLRFCPETKLIIDAENVYCVFRNFKIKRIYNLKKKFLNVLLITKNTELTKT